MKKSLVLSVLMLPLIVSAQIKAVTENGDKVLLYDNGTWAVDLTGQYIPELKKIDKPDFKGTIIKSKEVAKIHKLTQKSATPNKITDDDEWFAKNQLTLTAWEVPNPFRQISGDIPSVYPVNYQGKMLVSAIVDNEYDILIYGKDFSEGDLLLAYNKNIDSFEFAFDFSEFVLSPEYVKEDLMFISQRINWAEIRNGIMYVATSHSTYAKSSNGMNAYITAIDLKTGKIIWRTKPLVCNSSNFQILGDMIICGYGFTAEPDFLFTINRLTGEVVQKLPLKSGPSYIIRKENELFIRTYNTDYVFKIEY